MSHGPGKDTLKILLTLCKVQLSELKIKNKLLHTKSPGTPLTLCSSDDKAKILQENNKELGLAQNRRYSFKFISILTTNGSYVAFAKR